jgi:hypothetical protein
MQRYPLPDDECSPAPPEKTPPQERFFRLAPVLDILKPISGGGDSTTRLGAGLIYRPFGIGAHIFGIGAQADTDFADEWNLMGRLQYTYSLGNGGLFRPTLAGLLGMKYVSEQSRPAMDFEKKQNVSGTLLNAGVELSLDINISATANYFPLLRTFSPFFAMHFTPEQEIPSSDEPSQRIKLATDRAAILGIRFGWDFFDSGGYH